MDQQLLDGKSNPPPYLVMVIISACLLNPEVTTLFLPVVFAIWCGLVNWI
jgi:hypothetical protein